MTDSNWNINDYKLSFDDIVFTGNVVDAPVNWKIGQIINYFHNTVIKDAINAILHGSELSGLTLGISALDYLAGYYSGHETTGQDFVNYLEKYFPDKYYPFTQSIWGQIRCGLLHNLVSKNPWRNVNFYEFIITKNPKNHLGQDENGRYIFSISTFLEDLRRSAIMYVYELVMKPEENNDLLINFENRFNTNNGASAIMVHIAD